MVARRNQFELCHISRSWSLFLLYNASLQSKKTFCFFHCFFYTPAGTLFSTLMHSLYQNPQRRQRSCRFPTTSEMPYGRPQLSDMFQARFRFRNCPFLSTYMKTFIFKWLSVAVTDGIPPSFSWSRLPILKFNCKSQVVSSRWSGNFSGNL